MVTYHRYKTSITLIIILFFISLLYSIAYHMTIKLSESQKKTQISDSLHVAEVMQQILKRENKIGRSQEHFWVVGLNNVNKILFVELIGLGRQNRVAANPSDIFRMGIYKLALKLILVHNHPSGDLSPSQTDISFTDRILKVGEILRIEVIDHLIISEDFYLSFADKGIMEQLKESDSWRLMEKDELELEQLQQLKEIAAAKRSASKKKALEIARKLKKAGLAEKMILEATGLKMTEIEKI